MVPGESRLQFFEIMIAILMFLPCAFLNSPKSYVHVSKFAEQSRYLLLLKKRNYEVDQQQPGFAPTPGPKRIYRYDS